MDFRRLRNTDRSDVPHFVVEEKNGLLKDDYRQAEYKRYRAKYKACRGAFPELDRINNPAVAISLDEAYWPQDAEKASRKTIGGAFKGVMGGTLDMMTGDVWGGLGKMIGSGAGAMGQNPELLKEFGRRFNALVEPHKFIYGLACSGDCIPDLDNLREDEHIVDDVGYRFDRANGVYYEGTWSGGELVYGMMLLVDSGLLLMGDVRNGFISEGVARSASAVECGIFGDDGLECQEGLSWDVENGVMFLGPHKEDAVNGMAIALELESGNIVKQEYRMGYPLKGVSGMISRRKAQAETRKNTVNNILGKFKK